MKSFKSFHKSMRKIDPILITADPVHGRHSVPKTKSPVLVDAQPVHGEHSKRKIRESAEDVKDYHDWSMEHQNSHLGKDNLSISDKMSPSEEDFKKKHGQHAGAIKDYSEYSFDVNRHLIHQAKGTTPKGFGPERERKANNLIHHIDPAMESSRDNPEMHVYHGTSSWHPGIESAKHPEGHVRIPSYLSTSISKGEASFFSKAHQPSGPIGHHILHIHLPAGHKGIFLGNNSHHPEEMEHLLPRNTTLKIHPNPQKVSDNGKITHVWKANLVNNEEN